MGYEKERKNARNGGKPRTTKQRVDWQGFVDIILSQGDKEKLASESLLPDDFVGVLEYFHQNGYKISFSPDKAHQCVIATITGVEDDCLNVGYSLSGRGPSIEKALAVLWYKHSVLASEGLWSNVGSDRGGDLYG